MFYQCKYDHYISFQEVSHVLAQITYYILFSTVFTLRNTKTLK